MDTELVKSCQTRLQNGISHASLIRLKADTFLSHSLVVSGKVANILWHSAILGSKT